MSFCKNGDAILLFQQNGKIEVEFPGFVNHYQGGSVKWDSTNWRYEVTSLKNGNASWGTGAQLKDTVHVPYGMWYRISIDVYTTTQRQIVIDFNNKSSSGNNWNGNDNDASDRRSVTWYTTTANTWTNIKWYGKNEHKLNTNKVDIILYDGIGLKANNNDTEDIVWYIANPKMELFYNWNDKFAIDSSTIYANEFIEY